MAALTRWVLAHRRWVVSGWVLLALAGAFAASHVGDAFNQDFSIPGQEGFKANGAITHIYGNGGNSSPLVAVVALRGGQTVRSTAVDGQLRSLDRRLARTMPGARIASYASTHSRSFVSADGRTTFALVYPRPDSNSFGQSPQTAKRLSRALAGATVAGAPVRVTGLDALRTQSSSSRGPGVLAESMLGGLGALVVLAFVFASFLAFVPLAMAVVSILTTFLLIWGVAELTSVSPIVEFLIALVGLGVAIDYTLLIVVRWREERARGLDEEQAVVRAMASAGRAVVFSGTTVAVGLLALIALPIPFLRSLGYGGLLIPLISVLVVCTLLPIVLMRFGHRLDWPHRRTDAKASRAWTRWARVVVRRRWAAALAGVAVLAALLTATGGMNLGTDNPGALSKAGPARQGLIELQRAGIGSGALTPFETLTPRSRAAAVAAAQARVEHIRGTVAPSGPAWQRGELAVVDAFSTGDGSSAEGRSVVSPLRTAAHAAAPGSLVGGQVSGTEDFINAVYGSFPLMLAIIAVLTFLLLARAFRSVLLPLKAVILNTLSVGAAWGALTLIWQHGYGSKLIWGISSTGALPQWIPLMVFAFLFGLSMDYEVFILARMRETFDETRSTSEAVVVGIGRTGRLVTSAALILFLSFAAMASGPNTDVKMLATGLAVGILLDATVVRSLLVPAIVSLFGSWNWWMPRPVARVLRVAPSTRLREPAGA